MAGCTPGALVAAYESSRPRPQSWADYMRQNGRRVVHYNRPEEAGFDSCGYAVNLETVVTKDWVELKDCRKLTRVKTRRLSLVDCTVKGMVTTSKKRFFAKRSVVQLVVTSSRDIVLRGTTVNELRIQVPSDDAKHRPRKLKLVDSRVGTLRVYIGNRVVDIITVRSTIGSMETVEVDNLTG